MFSLFAATGSSLPLFGLNESIAVSDEIYHRYPRTASVLLVLAGVFVEFATIAHLYSVNVPARDALVVRTGEITDAGNTTQFTDDIVFKIDGELPEYKYVDWYPNFQSAKRNIINGNEITVHAVPDDDTIWSIVFDDGTTTSYEKMVASKSRNKSFAKILAITFLSLIHI